MSSLEEMVDSLMEKMQTSHLHESRLTFTGDLSSTTAGVQIVHSSIDVHTGSDPSTLSSFTIAFCRRVSELEDNHPVRVRARRISLFRFLNYSFPAFPPMMGDNGGIVFSNPSPCVEISQCHVTSLQSVVSQFPNIEVLEVKRCPNLRSLQSLAGYCRNLELLNCQDCGLTFEAEELEKMHTSSSWDSTFETLSTNRNFHLFICDCKELNAVPSSIRLMRNNLETLSLSNLPELKCLPPTIGDLVTLSLINIANTGVKSVPPEIGRLNRKCSVFIQGDINDPPKCYRGSIDALRTYYTRRRLVAFKGLVRLSILFQRSRSRAIERLFCPGGGGYKRCRDHFLSMSTGSKKAKSKQT